MSKINIDEIAEKECQPIEVIVGGKTYIVGDIPLDTMKKMNALGDVTGTDSVDQLIKIMSEILGADSKEIGKLGTRKFLALVKNVMDEINKEAEGKNVPRAEAPPKP